MTELKQRKFCRDPKCRMKLPKPTANPKEAFSTTGQTSFYRTHCIACEKPMERRSPSQKMWAIHTAGARQLAEAQAT
jgi:hypothetical protein